MIRDFEAPCGYFRIFVPSANRGFPDFCQVKLSDADELGLPATEMSFIEKAIAKREHEVIAVLGKCKTPVFVIPNLYYTAGVCASFFPDVPLKDLAGLGDLLDSVCASPRFARYLNECSVLLPSERSMAVADTVSKLLNINNYLKYSLKFDDYSDTIVAASYKFAKMVFSLCHCDLNVSEDFPSGVIVPIFDLGAFAIFVFCAVAAKDPVFEVELSFFCDSDAVLYADMRFENLPEPDVFEPASENARRNGMIFYRSDECRAYVISPVRHDVAVFGLKDGLNIDIDGSKYIL